MAAATAPSPQSSVTLGTADNSSAQGVVSAASIPSQTASDPTVKAAVGPVDLLVAVTESQHLLHAQKVLTSWSDQLVLVHKAV